jgi:hypothetical protein
LLGPRTFWTVIVAAVAVVIAPFFAAIIIAMRRSVGASSPGDVVLMLLVGLRQIRIREIVDVAAFDLVGEAMLHGALIDGIAE